MLCRAQRQEQGGAAVVLPLRERAYNATPTAVSRRREEETHTLK